MLMPTEMMFLDTGDYRSMVRCCKNGQVHQIQFGQCSNMETLKTYAVAESYCIMNNGGGICTFGEIESCFMNNCNVYQNQDGNYTDDGFCDKSCRGSVNALF